MSSDGTDKAGRLAAERKAEELRNSKLSALNPPFPFEVLAFDGEFLGLPANPPDKLQREN